MTRTREKPCICTHPSAIFVTHLLASVYITISIDSQERNMAGSFSRLNLNDDGKDKTLNNNVVTLMSY